MPAPLLRPSLYREALSMKKLSLAITVTALVTAAGLVTTACGDDDATVTTSDAGTTTSDAAAAHDDAWVPEPTVDAAAPSGATLTLSFAAKVGSEPYACGKTFSVGSPATTIAPIDLRFYVSEVKLVRADGTKADFALVPDGKWQLDDVALLDFEDATGACATDGTPETNTTLRGKAPAGSYVGVEFVVGVPFARNHGNQATAPSPLNLGQMFWSWRSGYKFLKIDGQPMTDAGAPRFNIHLGSVACNGADPADGGTVTSCDKPNRAPVRVVGTAPLDLGAARIVIDWAAILAGSDVTTNGGGPGGCMSFPADPECSALFDRLGVDYGTGQPKSGGTAFRLE